MENENAEQPKQQSVPSRLAQEGVNRLGKQALSKLTARIATSAVGKAIGAAVANVAPGIGHAIFLASQAIGALVKSMGGNSQDAGMLSAGLGMGALGLAAMSGSGALAAAGAALAATGAAIGGVGAIAGAAGAIAGGILGAIGAIGTTVFTGIGTGSLFMIFFTLFAFLVINSGAYVTPKGAPMSGSSTDPSASDSAGVIVPNMTASGSCPVLSNITHIGGSYNPSSETGHGSNEYWGGRSCSYSIPIAHFGGCLGPNVVGSQNNQCRIYYQEQEKTDRLCPYYGFAVDYYAPSGTPIILPYLCDSSDTTCDSQLTWTYEIGWFNCNGTSDYETKQACMDAYHCENESDIKCKDILWGYGVVYRASGNGHSWKIYLNHISSNPAGTHRSGTQISTVSSDLGIGSHLHAELLMDGVPIRPDFLCR